MDIEGNYDLDDAGQAKLVTDIGEVAAAVMTFSDGSTASCDVIIGKYDVANELDDVIKFTCPLKVTGPITRVA